MQDYEHHNIYRWYKVKHILGPPGCLHKMYFRNIFTIKLFTNMVMNGFIVIYIQFGRGCSLRIN